MGEWAAFFSLCLCSPPIQTWFCLAFFSRVFVFRMHTTWACNRARFTLSVISASAINLSILCAVRRMARSIHFFSRRALRCFCTCERNSVCCCTCFGNNANRMQKLEHNFRIHSIFAKERIPFWREISIFVEHETTTVLSLLASDIHILQLDAMRLNSLFIYRWHSRICCESILREAQKWCFDGFRLGSFARTLIHSSQLNNLRPIVFYWLELQFIFNSSQLKHKAHAISIVPPKSIADDVISEFQILCAELTQFLREIIFHLIFRGFFSKWAKIYVRVSLSQHASAICVNYGFGKVNTKWRNGFLFFYFSLRVQQSHIKFHWHMGQC